MRTFNEVTIEEVQRLNDFQLTTLLKKLLHLESYENNLPQSATTVSLKINVPDGGEDGRIKWENGISHTDYIPNRFTIFQCKATSMGPEKSKTEVLSSDFKKLKPRIEEVLDNNGTYILFVSHKVKNKRNNIAKIRQSIADIGKKYSKTANLDVYDCEKIVDWINKFTATIVYVKESLGSSVPMGLKTWALWNDSLSLQNKYFLNDQLQNFITQIKDVTQRKQSVLRVVGLSGLGKTRLVLEVFRPSENENDTVQNSLNSQVLYFDASFSRAEYVKNFITDLCNQKIPAKLIIDNCEKRLHDSLKDEVQRVNGKISLITIDYDPDTSATEYPIKLEPSILINIVKNMLDDSFPDLSDSDRARISEFVQGFPKLAVLLAKDRKKGLSHIGNLDDQNIIEKLLWGRSEKDKDDFNIIKGCSIFEHFGFSEDFKEQRKFIAEVICNTTEDVFYKTCNRFIKQGVLDQRGRFLRVTPKPLAINLAASWWRDCIPDKAKSIISEVSAFGLSDPLCRQMSKLDFLKEAKELVKDLCGEQAPFGQAEVLNTEEGSLLFRSFVEVNPQATSDAIFRVYNNFSTDELLLIGPGRRNLIWALEKLCFWSDTFLNSSRVMLLFASAENESWANNATNQFIQLFQVFLSGTQATLQDRLPVLKETINSKQSQIRNIGILALGRALQTDNFTRSGGVEQQGSKVTQQDYNPKLWKEIHEYWQICLSYLVEIVTTSEGEESELAKREISTNIRGLINQGRIEIIESAIKKITDVQGKYWPVALEQLKMSIQYDGKRFPPDYIKKIKSLIILLTPENIIERIKLIVSNPGWESKESKDGKYIDIAEQNAKKFADEIFKEKIDIIPLIPLVLKGEQRQAYTFGQRLGELYADHKSFLTYVVDIFEKEKDENGNPLFIMGYLSSIQERDIIDLFINRFSNNDYLINFIVEIIRAIKSNVDDLNLLVNLVKSEKLEISKLKALTYGRPLSHLDTDTVSGFCLKLASIDQISARYSFEILFMYSFSEKEKRQKLEGAFRELLLKDLINNTNDFLELYRWKDIAVQLVNKSKTFSNISESLLIQMLNHCKRNRSGTIEETYLSPVLYSILNKFFDEAWPEIGNTLLSTDWIINRNISKLIKPYRVGQTTEFKSDEILLKFFESNYNNLLKWCDNNLPRAPIVLAGIMPLFLVENNIPQWHAFAMEIISKYNDNKDFLNSINSHLNSFTWSGSLVPFYQNQLKLMEPLKDHSIMGIREWASDNINWLFKQIAKEKEHDEEFYSGIN